MFELLVVSESGKGRRFRTDAALVRLGRQADLEVSLPDPGVWDLHAEIQSDSEGWFMVRCLGSSVLTVNQHPVQEHRLRNGDVMGLGAVKLQFGLRNSAQRPLGIWEIAVWTLIVGVTLSALGALIAIGR